MLSEVSETWSRVDVLRPPPQLLRECVERRAEWPRGRGRADQALTPLAELIKSARSGFHNLLTGQIAHHVVNDLHLSLLHIGETLQKAEGARDPQSRPRSTFRTRTYRGASGPCPSGEASRLAPALEM